MIRTTRDRLTAVALATVLSCGTMASPALAAPAAPEAASAAASVAVGDRLEVGGTLRAGEQLVSAASYQGGAYRLVMQTDGNAVVYSPAGGAIWVTGTSGAGNSLTLQADGNIVVYSAQGGALWSSASVGRGTPAFLAMQNDGNLVSYSAAGAPLWSSRGEDTLVDGAALDRGEALVSVDGRYRAVLQSDGNLVVYGLSGVRWSSGTRGGLQLINVSGDILMSSANGSPWYTGTRGAYGAELVMQTDGNLVVYTPDGVAVWSSDAGSPVYRNVLNPGDQLSPGQSLQGTDTYAVLQSDGNFVVYALDGPASARWSSGTSGAGNRVVMQSDGNAVVYSASGRALWSSGTGGNPGAAMVSGVEGDLVVRSGAVTLWSSGS